MSPRLLSFTSCLLLLSFCLLVAAVDAQQSEIELANSQNLSSEVSNLRNQASRGDAMAEYKLGRLYLTGTGVSVSYIEAARYLRLAAEQGLPAAEMVLGYLYEQGK